MKPDKQSVLLNNTKKKSILIMAGDYGISSYMEEMVLSLLAIGDYEITVICGRNEKVKHKLDVLQLFHPNLNVLGYISNIHEYMSNTTCIVTKAGGLTLTEAISLRIPIFIFKPYAGQERENAIFFPSANFCFRVSIKKNLASARATRGEHQLTVIESFDLQTGG